MIALLATALGVALLTWSLGWWGVVVAALVAGAVLGRRRGSAWLVALSAITAWGALILLNSIGGRFATLAASIAGVMRVPAARLRRCSSTALATTAETPRAPTSSLKALIVPSGSETLMTLAGPSPMPGSASMEQV